MKIQCPKCTQPVVPGQVNASTDLAFCPACNEGFRLSESLALTVPNARDAQPCCPSRTKRPNSLFRKVAVIVSLLLLTVATGAIVLNHQSSQLSSLRRFSEETLPGFALSNDLENHLLMTMYRLRVPPLTAEAAALQGAARSLEEVQSTLRYIKVLGDEYNNHALRDAHARMVALVDAYKPLLNDSAETNAALGDKDKQRRHWAKDYLAACGSLRDEVERRQSLEGNEQPDNGRSLRLTRQLKIANQLIDLGQSLQVEFSQCLASHDLTRSQELLNRFPEITQKLNELSADPSKPKGATPVELPANVLAKHLEAIEQARTNYQDSLEGYCKRQRELDELTMKRSKIADELLCRATELTDRMKMAVHAGTNESLALAHRTRLSLIFGLIAISCFGTLLLVLSCRHQGTGEPGTR